MLQLGIKYAIIMYKEQNLTSYDYILNIFEESRRILIIVFSQSDVRRK